MFGWLTASVALFEPLRLEGKVSKSVDVCVYGGTSAGVIAAYAARQSGKSVLLIEPGRHLGGMSSGGLGYTDIGNKYVVRGLALDFYRRLGRHYGKFEQWIFEPKAAEAVFNEYIERAGVEVWYESRILSAVVTDGMIRSIRLENSVSPSRRLRREVRAKVYIDCSYEGDLMARAGVGYSVGREDNGRYGETYNGVQLMDRHQFPDGIDPYVIEGDSSSGLLYGISPEPVEANGTADRKVQAYNYRITLTDRPGNRVEITKPDHYDPQRYELLLRLKRHQPWQSLRDVFIWNEMPNGKTDINNFGGFSTDVIGENWNYPEAGYSERERIRKFHEDYTKGLLYFIGHDPRIPDSVRREMQRWGYPADEYADNGYWSHQLYVREARRMVGELVMTQHHCEGRQVVPDPVGWAAYGMDSHNCDRHVVGGMVKNEGNVEIALAAPYPISYRAITPKRDEVGNLLVPVCLSASHIAYGSIRMEPVFMVLSQSAAIAACLAIDRHDGCVQDVDAATVMERLLRDPLADGSRPDIFVDNRDASSVVVNGEWETVANPWRAYGPDYLSDRSAGALPKSVRYVPEIVSEGLYDVYLYVPKIPGGSSLLPVTVYDGKESSRTCIRAGEIVVTGQTGGEWVRVGRYRFSAGNRGYVEVSNKGADGTVVADAVLLVHADSGDR